MKEKSPEAESHAPSGIPETPVGRWVQPFARFFQIESASGVLLLACTAIALVLANSLWSTSFAEIWQIRLRFAIGNLELNEPLLLCINDGLMTIFFFVVGLEIKRELVSGELRNPRNAALPIVAALGGMFVPAVIYLLFQGGQPGQSGWGVPVATDIAFVAGFLALFGSRVPASLKVMLLTLAIVDDIGAILLIAIFYSSDISWSALGLASMGLGTIYFFNRIGVRLVSVYVVVGAGVWLAFLKSGVHPTVAGVLLGFMTPAKAWVGPAGFPKALAQAFERLTNGAADRTTKQRHRALSQLTTTAREGTSPLERLEFALHPWVAFLIMPLFALANAGISIKSASLASPVALAVAGGLVFGKPIGIVAFSWIATKLGLVRLPAEVNWKVMLGAGCLAGIGFTMSIFIAGLALEGDLLDDGKFGTLVGSTISAILGCVLLLLFMPKTLDVSSGGSNQMVSDNVLVETQASETTMQALCKHRWRENGEKNASNKE